MGCINTVKGLQDAIQRADLLETCRKDGVTSIAESLQTGSGDI